MSRARDRRKAMLGDRLEPVVKTTIRRPHDGSMAKSGIVHFTDADDNVVLAVWVEARPTKRGMEPVVHTQSKTHLVNLTAQVHEPAEEAR